MKSEEIKATEPFAIVSPPFYIVPIFHYTMELAACVRAAFCHYHPDCVAVELPEPLQDTSLRAASRLPDISVITSFTANEERLCYLAESCDAGFEAIRSALDAHVPAFCIDLDVAGYPELTDRVPDPYAISCIGLKKYYEAYAGCFRPGQSIQTEQDKKRELYMAKRLKELSFSYEKILVVVGMDHVPYILQHLRDSSYPVFSHATRTEISLATLSEESNRNVTAECGWITKSYEDWREQYQDGMVLPDRQKFYYDLMKYAEVPYEQEMLTDFPQWAPQTIWKFLRNWSHLHDRLLPQLFQLITACKACVDHNYAYEVWKLASEFPFRKNVDSLPELDLSIKDIWGQSKRIQFHLRKPSEKSKFLKRLAKDRSKIQLYPPNPFSICSYPPEDGVIEDFGDFLKKKAKEVQLEEGARTIVFSTSLEDGIDTKETIRHWMEKKLYVKARGRPPGLVSSCVIIFDEDLLENGQKEKYPWRLTWLGEHEQESDMAFYATAPTEVIVGPGIARCQYGGLMLSSPPRRVYDVWHDPDYSPLRTKAEVLLAAAIDYAVKPVIVYVATKPTTPLLKQHARRQGKRILFLPLTQFSERALKNLRTFHVLDGFATRKVADDYIH